MQRGGGRCRRFASRRGGSFDRGQRALEILESQLAIGDRQLLGLLAVDEPLQLANQVFLRSASDSTSARNASLAVRWSKKTARQAGGSGLRSTSSGKVCMR